MAETAAGIETALAEWVGGVLGVPCDYGEFGGEGYPRAMVKVGNGDPVVTRYRAGGGVYRVPYEAYLCTFAVESADRVGGIEALRRLEDAIRARECPDGPVRYTSHEVTNSPALYAQADGGEVVYQMTAELRYMQRG